MSAASAPASASIQPSSRRPRRLRRVLLANLFLSLGLALSLFVMALYLSSRHYLVLHTPSAACRPLSEKTQRLLTELSEDLHLYALVRPGHPAAGPLRRLLELYASASPYVHVELVDPDRELAVVEQLEGRYSPPAGEVVVVAQGNASRAIAADELLLEEEGEEAGAVRWFRGESLVSAAIYDLLQPTPQQVSFLQGHGERSPFDFSASGFSSVADLLRQDNLGVETLFLPDAKAVPPQTALLVVAGPTSPLSRQELVLVRDYLSRKGRMLVLLDALASSGLEPLLREWGVALDQDAVIDPAHSLDGRDLHVVDYAPVHPVTESLASLQTVLNFPRSVRAANPEPAPDDPVATPLLLSAATAWADVHPLDPSPRFNAQADLPGPVPLALAIERGMHPGLRAEMRPTRLVVVGDSDFAANASLRAANATFFLNAVNWLVDRPDHLGIPASPLPPPAASLSAAGLRWLALWLVAGLPAGTALVCLLPRVFRRRGRRTR